MTNMIDSIKTRFVEAVNFLNEGKLESALSLGKDLLERSPDSSVLAGFIGEIYYSRYQSPEQALPYFIMVAKLSPASERGSVGLFHCLWDIGEEEKAVAEMKRFLTFSPDSQAYDEIIKELKNFYC